MFNRQVYALKVFLKCMHVLVDRMDNFNIAFRGKNKTGVYLALEKESAR